ncbi:MAG: histidine phosphatase family protein [Myxococcales bacterium]|nr:histidine phosphatase family protein [Myxococcales bacterium]MCB9754778.1 histidine phosphatase family protein [Myxococcales bacterium]
MKILLLRHGEAVPERAAGSDARRWLTKDGRDALRTVAAVAREQGVSLTQIYTSPLVRAVQTAELLAHGLGYTGEIIVHNPLNNAPIARILAPLEAHEDGDTVALVGHNPAMNTLAGFLSGRRHFPGYPPGGLCLVEGDPGAPATEFRWMINPKTGERVTRIRDLMIF